MSRDLARSEPSFVLDGRGVSRRVDCVERWASVLEASVETHRSGVAILRVGPIDETPGYPDINGRSIELDAGACRHLAGRLNAAADQLSHLSPSSGSAAE